MPHLNDNHREQLRASGISDDMIDRSGIYSAADAEIREILGWQPRGHAWGTGMVIPFTRPDGTPAGFCRVRLDHPRSESDGKVVKYETPKGKTNHAYFPPGVHEVLKNPAIPLWLPEGEKKGLALQSRGRAAIGLTGVFAWQKARKRTDAGKTYGKREPIDDLVGVEWRGRTVYIPFDSDKATKRMVQLAEQRLSECLTALGATVLLVTLPPGNEGAKVGIDDFIVGAGDNAEAELQKLVATAQPAEEPPPPTAREWATIFMEDQLTHKDGRMLAWHRDQLFVWRKNKYHVYSDEEFSRMVLEWLANQQHPDPRMKLANEIVAHLQAMSRIPFELDPPLFTLGRPVRSPHLISMRNHILDINALLGDKGAVTRAHTPLFFSTIALPYDYDPDADCPTWRDFLEEIFEGDTQRIEMWQEWCGYNLVYDTSLQKFLLGPGEGANGKGVCTDVLKALVGDENCSHVRLEMFHDKFALTSSLGKLANIATEVGEMARADEGKFKAFVSADPMQFDRKNISMIECRPTARCTIMCNARPRWLDRSNGIWRRMLYLPFNYSIPEEEQDRTLAARIIAAELSGVFCWALAGLMRLREQGQFTLPDISRQEMEEYRAEANPARAFLLNDCMASEGAEIRADHLYSTYKKWALDSGYKPINDVHFGREIRRHYPKVDRFRKSVNGVQKWHLLGIDCPSAINPANHWQPAGRSWQDGKDGDEHLYN